MWLRDYHGDGLRLDAVHAIVDTSARHILEQLAVEVDALGARTCGRPLFLIAESDRNDPRSCAARAAGGYGLAAAWADEWHHAPAHRADRRARRLLRGLRLAGRSWPRRCARRGCTTAPTRRTGTACTAGRRRGSPVTASSIATQTHDQVGNRAAGERLAALHDRRAAEGRRRAAPHGAVRADAVHGRGVGGEHAVPVLHRPPGPGARRAPSAKAGAASSRPSAGTPPACPTRRTAATFERSKLRWAERHDGAHGAEVLAWYRQLDRPAAAHARRWPTAAWTSSPSEADEATGLVVVRRGAAVTVVANLGRRAEQSLAGRRPPPGARLRPGASSIESRHVVRARRYRGRSSPRHR